MSLLWSTVISLSVGTACAAVGRALRLPGGALIGAMVGTASLHLVFEGLAPLSPGFRTAAQILIGAAIGSSIKRDALRALRPVAGPALLVVAAIVLVGFSSGVGLAAVTDLPLITTLFSTAPGGASDMSAAALQFDADIALITAFHLVRQIAVYTIMAAVLSRHVTSPARRRSPR